MNNNFVRKAKHKSFTRIYGDEAGQFVDKVSSFFPGESNVSTGTPTDNKIPLWLENKDLM